MSPEQALVYTSFSWFWCGRENTSSCNLCSCNLIVWSAPSMKQQIVWQSHEGNKSKVLYLKALMAHWFAVLPWSSIPGQSKTKDSWVLFWKMGMLSSSIQGGNDWEVFFLMRIVSLCVVRSLYRVCTAACTVLFSKSTLHSGAAIRLN